MIESLAVSCTLKRGLRQPYTDGRPITRKDININHTVFPVSDQANQQQTLHFECRIQSFIRHFFLLLSSIGYPFKT